MDLGNSFYNLLNVSSVSTNKSMRTLGIGGRVENKYRYHVLKNTIKAWFADQSDDGVKLEYDQKFIELILENSKKSKAVVEENKIKYKKVFDNCDLIYTVLPGQVKDELIFYSLPKTPVISYRVKMDQKLIPKNGPEGTVELIDVDGKAVFQLLPAFMYEKNNPEVSKAVETKFHWDQNELFCDLILDLTWLKDKKRQYPIIIDPIAP